MITAVVGVIGSVIVALLARLAGLTGDDRRRAQIVRDAKLWKALPDDSAARAPLAEHIADATTALLAKRKDDRRISRLWIAGAWSAFAGWVLLLVFSAFPFDPFEPFWQEQVRHAVFIAVVIAAVLAPSSGSPRSCSGAPRAWTWLRARSDRS